MPSVNEIKDNDNVKHKIDEEVKRLNKVFDNVPKETKSSIQSLIHNAAFMSVILDEIQNHITINGVVSEYQNGANQWGTKKSPEVEIYNTMIKNYTNVVKQLTDIIQRVGLDEENDGFDEFLKKRMDMN